MSSIAQLLQQNKITMNNSINPGQQESGKLGSRAVTPPASHAEEGSTKCARISIAVILSIGIALLGAGISPFSLPLVITGSIILSVPLGATVGYLMKENC